jgi:hypothetical protein
MHAAGAPPARSMRLLQCLVALFSILIVMFLALHYQLERAHAASLLAHAPPETRTPANAEAVQAPTASESASATSLAAFNISAASRRYFWQTGSAARLVTLTYANNVQGRLCDNLARHVYAQLPLHVLGYQPDDDPPLPSRRPREKEYHIGSRLLLQAMACSVLPPATLVVMGDSMDVLLQGNESTIATAFEATAVDWAIDQNEAALADASRSLPRVVAAAEADCWPPSFLHKYAARYENRALSRRRLAPPHSPFRHLNGGGFAGPADAALRWLRNAMGERAEWEEHENRWNAAGSDYENFPYRSAQWTQWRAVEPNPPYMRRPDQIMLHDLLLGDAHNAYVDYNARLWQCMQVTRPYANANFWFDTAVGQWQNTDTGAYPAYFHYNGPCKYVLADTAASLNLVCNRIMRAHLARRGEWNARDQLRG